ncbi:hypothetical protein SFC57_22335 [Niallia circulans]|uniref:hypothetical protein n=1 Tax=Niallia circulans TaxID=1397 RepID=UPI00155F8594|nr:hypothetical protein [Niallia circulans]NRG34340.1 hypothetical protein [Niallia circulans]
MKGLALFLMLFYFLVTGLWIANSPYLFSVQGMIVWLISIVPGFVMYKQIIEINIIKRLMLYFTFFMVLLLIITGLIHWAVNSMH